MLSKTNIFFIGLLILSFFAQPLYSQDTLSFDNLKREDVLKMDYDYLLGLPLDQLIKLAEIVGVSPDELLELILNRDVTSASKKAESLFDSPLSTSVVSSKEISNSGATTIEEVFRLIPGMIVRQKTSGNYDVHIRGNDNIPPRNMLLYSENTMSLVMIDGRVVYNYAHGGTLWETLPISVNDIERVEVIRGPATALYGPNAVTGAINIVTKRPDTKKAHANADMQIGTLNTKIAHASVSLGASKKLRFKISGNYKFQDRHTSDLYVWKNAMTQRLSQSIPGLLNNGADYYSYDYIKKHSNQLYAIEKDFAKRINDKDFGIDRYGVNAYVYYDINDNSRIDFSAGTQNSEAITTIFSLHNVPYNRRTSQTNYINLNTKISGLELKLSYQNGTQNIEEGNTFLFSGSSIASEPYKFDLQDIHSSLEYEFNFKKFTIRPGISYQSATRDDGDYVDVAKKGGFFNGSHELSSFAYFLRGDYRPTENLRLIAALRGDKYETPDVSKFTYQFIASYKINEKNLIRAVYSKANRGPFMTDTKISYKWPLKGITTQFDGNEDLKLASMEMFELGYNIKPVKNIQASFELFHQKSKDFGSLTPTKLEVKPVAGAMLPTLYMSYLNQPLKVIQTGFTFDINYVASQKLQIKAFATAQKTELKDYFDHSPVEIVQELRKGIDPSKKKLSSDQRPEDYKDTDHKSTPDFYGGIYINYLLMKNLNINLNTYIFGEQKFVYQDETKKVDPFAVLNFKASYRFWKKHSVYFNLRNLASSSNEFAFTDKIKPFYLVGLNLSF